MPDRRDLVPFDPRHHARQRRPAPLADVFAEIYRTNHWNDSESVSGEGSGAAQTARLEAELPGLLRAIGAKSLLDAPCGDFGWMRRVDLSGIAYTGADIVPELVEANQARYGSAERRFVALDVAADLLPAVDVMLCRDLLVHLSFVDVWRVLRNVRQSGIAYLLTTTFPAQAVNEDIVSGDWRPLNLEHPPFSFPPPIQLLIEGCTEGAGRFADKSLGLWRVADLHL